MTIRTTPLLLVAAVIGAAAFAVFRGTSSTSDPTAPSGAPPSSSTEVAPALPAADPHAGALPPDHPPIGLSGSADGAGGARAAEEQGPIAWSAPEGFTSVPNPNSMRLATFKVSGAKGEAEEVELAISRAGGSTDANIERWLGQFEEHEKEIRKEKTVAGFKVTTVEINGTYKSASMMGMGGDQATSKKDWSFIVAIVETAGEAYFFKLTGPRAPVKAARKSFDAMVDGVKPAPSAAK